MDNSNDGYTSIRYWSKIFSTKAYLAELCYKKRSVIINKNFKHNRCLMDISYKNIIQINTFLICSLSIFQSLIKINS